MRLLIGAVLAASILPTAAGAEPAAPSSYKVSLRLELPIVAVAATMASAWALRDQLSPAHCAPLCERAELFRGDRWAAGKWSPGWKRASDVGAYTILGGVAAAQLVRAARD